MQLRQGGQDGEAQMRGPRTCDCEKLKSCPVVELFCFLPANVLVGVSWRVYWGD